MFNSITFNYLSPYFGYSATFISVCILCEFAMLLDVYIILHPPPPHLPGRRAALFLLKEQMFPLAPHSSKILNPLSGSLLVCLGNT